MTGPGETPRTAHARRLFDGIADGYERMGRVLSLGREGSARRTLVDVVDVAPRSLVLDAAAGTGLVARELVARRGARVVALDASEAMLRAGFGHDRAGVHEPIHPIAGRAERLPFADGAFDAATFTYLLRYVDDPPATLAELARVLRRGGVIAMLEFWRPSGGPPRWWWWTYTRIGLPMIGAAVSPSWFRTGRFLGPSISRFVEETPLPVLVRWFQDAGIRRIRTREILFGTWIVVSGTKA